jgi:hypothetical protein
VLAYRVMPTSFESFLEPSTWNLHFGVSFSTFPPATQ